MMAGGVAAEPDNLQPVPDGAPEIGQGDDNVPVVTVRRSKQGLLREYRIGGQLRMVEVIPKIGPPYVLLDSDNNGSLDQRIDDLNDRMLIPGWVIFRW